jgi:hypothetical protein
VVEGARLESAYTAKNRIVGSNPTPSAISAFHGRPVPSSEVQENPATIQGRIKRDVLDEGARTQMKRISSIALENHSGDALPFRNSVNPTLSFSRHHAVVPASVRSSSDTASAAEAFITGRKERDAP